MFCSTTQRTNVTYSASNKIKIVPSQRTKKDYFAMLKFAKRGYPQLTPQDKYIYEIFTEYDYQNERTGLCKGFIYASFERIEADYGIKTSTLYRSYRNLEKAGLVKRRRRMNTSSVIYLLELPTEQLSTKQSEGQLSKMANAINRINEKNRRFATRLDFVKALNEEAVTRLIAYGYNPKAAVRDCLTYGVEELETQLANLTLFTAHGGIIHDWAKWLNFGIHHRRRIDPSQLKAELHIDTLYRALCTSSGSLPPLEERMELVEDDGYTYYRERESVPPADSKPPLPNGVKSYSTIVLSDAPDAINPTNPNDQDYPAYVPHSSLISTSFPLPTQGGGYYYPENATLPQQAAPDRSASSGVVATRAPAQKRVLVKWWRSGLVDRSGRGLSRVWYEKACEKDTCTESGRRGMRSGGADGAIGTTEWKKREKKLVVIEIGICSNYFKGTVYCMELRRIYPIPVRKKRVEHLARKTRIDKDSTPLTDRDLTVLTWIGEMYLARFDQVKVLLERNTQLTHGEAHKSLTPHAVRKVILRWLRRGVVGYKKILAYQSGYVWLTRRGLREMGFKETERMYRDWEPRPTTIEHYYWVNQVRLWYEQAGSAPFHWVSERTLKARKENRTGHDADAEIYEDAKIVALEVELSTKSPEDAKAIMRTLLRERVEHSVYKYAQALYVTNARTAALITRTKAQFPPEEQQRIAVQSILDYV